MMKMKKKMDEKTKKKILKIKERKKVKKIQNE
jgi:hypothetical protein